MQTFRRDSATMLLNCKIIHFLLFPVVTIYYEYVFPIFSCDNICLSRACQSQCPTFYQVHSHSLRVLSAYNTYFVFSVVTIFAGVELAKANAPPFIKFILIAYVCYQLTIYTYFLFSVVTIFAGVELAKANAPPFIKFILIAYVCYQLLLFLFLEIHSFASKRAGE